MPELSALIASLKTGDVSGGDFTEVETTGFEFSRGAAAGYEDQRFPLIGRNLDTASGRLDYNFFNAGIDFNANARYPNEPISILQQLPHAWEEGSTLSPHLHWNQISSNEPNWLIGYRIFENGQPFVKVTDYTSHTFLTKDSNAFTYTSGSITQITVFPDLVMTGKKISTFIHWVLFRDSANTSGEFAGVDPSSSIELAFDFDIHYKRNSKGSRQKFVK